APSGTGREEAGHEHSTDRDRSPLRGLLVRLRQRPGGPADRVCPGPGREPHQRRGATRGDRREVVRGCGGPERLLPGVLRVAKAGPALGGGAGLGLRDALQWRIVDVVTSLWILLVVAAGAAGAQELIGLIARGNRGALRSLYDGVSGRAMAIALR